ncbi:unnamed protein product [Microthlaspi erraticum]|uniref:NYN domain-containing protein n=1 Tax=Microthlaspi erraticum TaxID=1685480 RepID=A0A6D2IKM5_9BRAS|nr:unnamed protein product [Microthlaspi erraticum]
MATYIAYCNTSVFWDVNDFPVPEGRAIREIVESALEKQGYNWDASITVYGDKDPFSPEETAEAQLTFVERSAKFWRLEKMLVDIHLLAVDNPKPYDNPTAVMLVAKNSKESAEFFDYLERLGFSGFQVLLVVPDDLNAAEVPVPDVALAWRWTNLLENGDPIPTAEYEALVDQRPDCCVQLVSDDEDDDDCCEDDC